MRIIGNILLILFVIGTVYAVLPDLKKFYDHNISVLTDSIPALSPNNAATNDAPKQPLPENNPTPGPLVVDPLKGKNVTKVITGTIQSDLVIQATNKERTNLGFAPLTMNVSLTDSANAKVDDMFKNSYFEHVSPSGKTLADLAEQINYKYILIGENLAMGDFKDSNDVVTAWMNSPGHRANILNPKYTEIGVAAKKGLYQGREVWMVVQHFGTPQSACGTIDASLKIKIDTEQKDLDVRTADLNTRKNEIENGGGVTDFNYQTKVEEYNALVKEYNDLVAQIKSDISAYNDQVHTFNDCARR